MLSASVVALLAFAAAANALPGGSPLCSVDGAAEKLTGGMGANAGKIPCTFTSDKTSYTPGATMTITWACTDVDTITGLLAYASPQNEPARRVGSFTLLDGLKGNKAACGDASEADNSVVTHSAPGKFSPTGSITYTASATDHGNLEFSFIVVKKVDAGFRWGIFPKSIIVSAPGSSADSAKTGNTGTVAAGDEYNCNCPAAQTISIVRKCMPKTTATTKVIVTKTKTSTCTTTTTSTTTSTTTMTETVSTSCGAVAGGEATPTTTMKMKTTTTKMMDEKTTTTAAYGGGYGSYGNNNGGYSGYSAQNVGEDDEDVQQLSEEGDAEDDE